MKITSISITKIEKEDSRLRGVATIIMDDAIAIHNIRIIEGDNGLFVAMPSRKNSNDEYVDIVHPIKKEIREMIDNEIINSYTTKSNRGGDKQ